MPLAAFDDLVALGAMRPDLAASNPERLRATRLIAMASAQVCSFLVLTEAQLVAQLTAEDEITVATYVAEIAARRIQNPASPTTDPLANNPDAPWQTALLTDRDKARLLDVPSIATARVDRYTAGSLQLSPNVWLT